MIDLAAAALFIERHGTELVRLQLETLRHGRAAPESSRLLAADQQADGGFLPFWSLEITSLDATCYRLAQAEAAGLDPRDPVVADALRFLAWRQRADGAWEEVEEAEDLAPPWARPGDQAARLYLTAGCAYWLALWGQPEAAESGAAYLGDHLVDGRLPSFLQTTWLAAALFYLTGREEFGRALGDSLRSRLPDLEDGDISWAAMTLQGVAADHPFVAAACDRLVESQQLDGRWGSGRADDQDARTTLEVLRLLTYAGRIEPK